MARAKAAPRRRWPICAAFPPSRPCIKCIRICAGARSSTPKNSTSQTWRRNARETTSSVDWTHPARATPSAFRQKDFQKPTRRGRRRLDNSRFSPRCQIVLSLFLRSILLRLRNVRRGNLGHIHEADEHFIERLVAPSDALVGIWIGGISGRVVETAAE